MPTPTKIRLHKASKILELHFGAEQYELSCEFLRVHSPSAEVKGHGPGQEVLQYGKKNVSIRAIEAAGNYAIKLSFDDGHDSGIYSWDYLYQLCTQQESLWSTYLEKLHAANKTRDPESQGIRLIDPGKPD